MATGSKIRADKGEIPVEHFDYIVVGAGAGGPACARRLAEYMPDCSVALLEAGTTHEELYPATETPMAFTNLHFTQHDWKYFTVPQPAAKNRCIYLPRGRLLGGTTTGNATLLNRGVKGDWDDYAAAGNPGWDWESMIPFFRNVETFHQLGNEPYVSEVHGTKGPLHFQHAEPAPISHRIIKSFESKQIPRVIDMFSTGENEGVDHCLRSVHKGHRQHGGYYVQGTQKPDNLTIIFHCHCTRVSIDMVAGEWQAAGVEVNDPRTNLARKIKARKEVIVSAGTYNTPVILMHSGIGPKEHLSQFHIPVKQDLPGVGSNLTDHLMVWTFYEVNDPSLTNDSGYYPPENFQKSVDQWLATKDGPLAKFLIGPIAFRSFAKELEDMPEYHAAKAARPDLRDPTETPIGGPHIEWFSTEAYGGYEEQLDFPGEGRAAISLTTLLMNQCSRGTVRLSSYHPLAPPLIDHTYLSEPLDVELFAAGCEMAEDIIRTGSGTKDCVTGAWPPTTPHPTTREGWREWVRQRATTCYHPGGTAKMGPASDPTSVVDHRLRVHGIRGLRVADQSILPKLTSGHPQHPTYAIGEKCAFMIAEDAGANPVMDL